MAILRHISSKDGNYHNIIKHMMFQYNGNKLVLNDNGNPKIRLNTIEGINTTPFGFPIDCIMLNRQYHKNLYDDDVKYHRYIISFDPKDNELGLTEEKAHEIGMNFALKYFSEYQCVVCTSKDKTKNGEHFCTHIVINSVRKLNAKPQSWMTRDFEWKAGYKHSCSSKLYYEMKKYLMTVCEKEGLNQVDLLKHSNKKITTEEYYAKDRGQQRLDKTNKELTTNNTATETNIVFKTYKEKIRNAIDAIINNINSIDEYKDALTSYGIIAIEHENSNSKKYMTYKIDGYDRNISEKTLGTDYCYDYIIDILNGKCNKE